MKNSRQEFIDSAHQQRATSVTQFLIPPHAKEIVEKTVTQMNEAIREHMRAETGLKLSDDSTRQVVPVRVVEGFTYPLAELIAQYNDPFRLLNDPRGA